MKKRRNLGVCTFYPGLYNVLCQYWRKHVYDEITGNEIKKSLIPVYTLFKQWTTQGQMEWQLTESVVQLEARFNNYSQVRNALIFVLALKHLSLASGIYFKSKSGPNRNDLRSPRVISSCREKVFVKTWNRFGLCRTRSRSKISISA